MANDEKKQKALIEDLAEIVTELGWVIGLPSGEGMVPGLVVGTEEFVRDVVETYYGPNYDVFTEDPTGEAQLTEIDDEGNINEEIKKEKPYLH
jgi:hypothetical protein